MYVRSEDFFRTTGDVSLTGITFTEGFSVHPIKDPSRLGDDSGLRGEIEGLADAAGWKYFKPVFGSFTIPSALQVLSVTQ
jgi:hypothetical protein